MDKRSIPVVAMATADFDFAPNPAMVPPDLYLSPMATRAIAIVVIVVAMVEAIAMPIVIRIVKTKT